MLTGLHGCKSAVAAILSTLRSHFLTNTSFLHGEKGECSLWWARTYMSAVAAILSTLRSHFLTNTSFLHGPELHAYAAGRSHSTRSQPGAPFSRHNKHGGVVNLI